MKKRIDLLRVLYPRRCPVCHEVATPAGSWVCDTCTGKLPYIKEPCCKKCGKEVQREEQEYCHDCQKTTHSYTAGRAVFAYDSVMQASIAAFKYKGRQEYAEFYGRETARLYEKQMKRWEAEVLVPVPIHKSRYRERGYNQAGLLADQISKYTNIPVDETLLVRMRKTKAQKALSTKERTKNLQDAFQLGKNVVQYKRIVLVDDIYTTGSTADACARVLKEGGAEQVYLLCLSIGSGL